MKQIEAEGTTYIYFGKEEALQDARILASDVMGIPDQTIWNSILKTDMSDMRIILSRLLQADRLYFYFLHWDDGSDLEILDTKVATNTFTDEDFIFSVKTQFKRTKCFNCNWEGYTLVMPPAEPYIGAPGLEPKKLSLRYERKGFKTCPNCGANLTQDVVKIFGKSM